MLRHKFPKKIYRRSNEVSAQNDYLTCYKSLIQRQHSLTTHNALRLDQFQSPLLQCRRNISFQANSFTLKRQKFHLRWPKRVKHESVNQNSKQFPKTQINFPKHKSVHQNTNHFPKTQISLPLKTQNNFLKHKQFSKTQISLPKHKSVSQNTNQFRET